MPFKSEKQRRYLWKNEPEVAQRWADEAQSAGSPQVKKSFVKPKYRKKRNAGR